jgi:O-antigen ligase
MAAISETAKGEADLRASSWGGTARKLCLATVEAGVWILLITTPFALGSVSETATALMEGGCLSLLALAWAAGLRRRKFRLPRWFLWPVLGFCLWTLLQILPLPPALLGILSPGSDALYRKSLPGYATRTQHTDLESWLLAERQGTARGLKTREGEVTGLEGQVEVASRWRPLSWYPWLTVRWLSRFLAYTAFAILVAGYLSERAREKRLPWLVLVLGSVIATLGVAQYYTWDGKILWIIPVYQGHPFGPWVNSNHFSGYMEMALPLGCAVLLKEAGIGWSRRRRHRSVESKVPRLMLGGFMIGIMVFALLLAFSRGGLFSLAMAACLYLYFQIPALLPRTVPSWGKHVLRIAPLLLCLTGSALLLHLKADVQVTEVEEGAAPSLEARSRAWKGILSMIAANPVSGTGLGTFSLAYPPYKTYGEINTWAQAHNDYLQLFTESGLPGFLLLACGIVLLFRRALGPYLSKSWRSHPPVMVGACFGIVVLLIHSLGDFNLQVPSNGLLFSLLGGLILGAPGSMNGKNEESSAERSERIIARADR